MAASASANTLQISASGMAGNEMTYDSYADDEDAEEKPDTTDEEDVEGL